MPKQTKTKGKGRGKGKTLEEKFRDYFDHIPIRGAPHYAPKELAKIAKSWAKEKALKAVNVRYCPQIRFWNSPKRNAVKYIKSLIRQRIKEEFK